MRADRSCRISICGEPSEIATERSKTGPTGPETRHQRGGLARTVPWGIQLAARLTVHAGQEAKRGVRFPTRTAIQRLRVAPRWRALTASSLCCTAGQMDACWIGESRFPKSLTNN